MSNFFAEYVWLDGGADNDPTQNLRSKVKVLKSNKAFEFPLMSHLPEWGFDGSSTRQAESDNSDCILKPVRVIRDPLNTFNTDRDDSSITSRLSLKRTCNVIVLCEVLNADRTPHLSNSRQSLVSAIAEADDRATDNMWFGFEQEYTLYRKSNSAVNSFNTPLGFFDESSPDVMPTAPAQGPYYCGVGPHVAFGRDVALRHLDACDKAGLQICGINAEVMPGQWEFQIGPRHEKEGGSPIRISDELWLARFLLLRIAEQRGFPVSFSPKPLSGDWNGAGLHTNLSTHRMRQDATGKVETRKVIKALEANHEKHLKEYGHGLEKRLTGDHETCSYREFRHGVADRGASIRIPAHVNKRGSGYIEDRRPCSNADPYKVSARIISTIHEHCSKPKRAG